MKRFTPYQPWLPVSVVMSPALGLPVHDENGEVSKKKIITPVPEQTLVDCHFNINPECFTITVFKEYQYEMTKLFLESTITQLIKKSIETPNATLLLTPRTSGEVLSMGNLAGLLEDSDKIDGNYTLENSGDAKAMRECFGIYIQNGTAHFFGKSVNRDSLEYHLVPETNIVISICWEADFLGRFKQKLFDLGACLILHPSANSSESIQWERYENQEAAFPYNIKSKDERWYRTIMHLLMINPHINFIHVDYSASGIYFKEAPDPQSISLQRIEEEQQNSACVVKRVLRFSKKHADQASYEKTIHDRSEIDKTIIVPDSQGCNVM